MEKGKTTRAEEAALKAYPKETRDCTGFVVDIGHPQWIRNYYTQGYEQAEKDLGWHSVEESLPPIAMTDCHQSTYESKDGRLGFAYLQPMKDDCPVGRCHRHWRIDSTWYKSKKKFLEALAKVEL